MMSNKMNDGNLQFCQFYSAHCTQFDFCLRIEREMTITLLR